MAALRRSTDRPKRKVRKNTGRGIVLRRRPCQTSPSLEALVVDNGIPRIYAWGVCQETQIEYGENLGIEALKRIQRLDSLPKYLEEAIARDEGRNKLIVESYKKNAARYGKTLVFTVSIEHTKILTERFNQAGIKAAYVVSGTPHDERERPYNAYRNGDLQVLVNSSKIPAQNRLRDKFA